MNLLTIFTNVAITAIFFNGKNNELRKSHGQKHLRPLTLPHWTNQNVFPSFHLIHYSQTLSHPYFIPRCYNVFKAAPIVACRRSSNLSDFLVWAMSHNATSLGAHTHAEKTVSLANTYLTDKFHTHSTIQAKPDLSLITRGGRYYDVT